MGALIAAMVTFVVCCAGLGLTLGPFVREPWKARPRRRESLADRLRWYTLR